MARINLSTMSAQLAKHLREELQAGRWRDLMPGRDALASELAVSPKIVSLALQELEDEGLLLAQGPGRRRKIASSGKFVKRQLRIAIFLPDPHDAKLDFIVDLKYRLEEEGFSPLILASEISRKAGSSKKLARIVSRTHADAWILMSASRDTLEWFSSQPVPSFALFGRRFTLPIAATGPDKDHGMRVATQRLLELGHRRIVMLALSERRLPQPGAGERSFLRELENAGIETSSYNLPHWIENARGLQERVDSMFAVTPPTAIIVDGPPLFLTVLQYITRLGYKIPDDVSLICTDGDPYFDWQYPTIAHMRWDSSSWVSHIIKWAKSISKGRVNIKQHITRCDFIEGGTIGPAKFI